MEVHADGDNFLVYAIEEVRGTADAQNNTYLTYVLRELYTT